MRRTTTRRRAALALSLLAGCVLPSCIGAPTAQDLATLLPAAPEVALGPNLGRTLGADDVVADSVVFPADPVLGEYPRIPVLVRTGADSLLAVASVRRGSIADSAPSALRAAVSNDGGRTWDRFPLAENRTTADGDAAAVVDPSTGLVHVLGREQYTSADGGRTWTARPTVVLPNAAGITGDPGGPGAGIALRTGPHAGRLVVMCRATTTAPLPELLEVLAGRPSGTNCTLTSDDHGATWRTSTTVQPGVGEGAVVELADGRLYMSSRTYGYDGHRSQAYSDDGGSTWVDLGRSVLPEPSFGVNGSLTRATTTGGRDVVVYANVPEWGAPFGIVPVVRKDLSLYVSYDGTRSWRFARVLRRGPGAYTSMTALGGDIGVLYETVVEGVNDTTVTTEHPEGIRFTRVRTDALLD